MSNEPRGVNFQPEQHPAYLTPVWHPGAEVVTGYGYEGADAYTPVAEWSPGIKELYVVPGTGPLESQVIRRQLLQSEPSQLVPAACAPPAPMQSPTHFLLLLS